MTRTNPPANLLLLWEATVSNNVVDVRRSIAERVDINARDQFGMTALHRAAITSSHGALKVLLSVPWIDVHKVDNAGTTPLEAAKEFGDAKIVKALEAAIRKRDRASRIAKANHPEHAL